MKEWTEEQVNMLNELQVGIRYGHGYTCPNRSDQNNHFHNGNDLGCLIATPSGWECPVCGYTQDWLNTVDIHPDSMPLLQNINVIFNVEKDEQKEKEKTAWLNYFNNYSKVNLQKQLRYGWMKIDDVLNIVKSESTVKEIKDNIVIRLLEKMNETN